MGSERGRQRSEGRVRSVMDERAIGGEEKRKMKSREGRGEGEK